MLPGLSSAVEASIRKVLTPAVTALGAAHYEHADYHLLSARDEVCQSIRYKNWPPGKFGLASRRFPCILLIKQGDFTLR